MMLKGEAMACGYANSVILLGFLKAHKPRHSLDSRDEGLLTPETYTERSSKGQTKKSTSLTPFRMTKNGRVPPLSGAFESRGHKPLDAYSGWRLERMNSRRTVTLGP